MTGPSDWKELEMTALALARRMTITFKVFGPKTVAAPLAHNDNCSGSELVDYVRRSRREGGDFYQAADSKMWWLP